MPDLYAADFPHGLPAGAALGCKTNGQCPNAGTEQPTCQQAAIRYAGDYSYRKAVDAGTVPVPIPVLNERPAPRRAFAPAQEEAEAVRRGKSTPHGLRPDLVHGTTGGYQRGCHEHKLCPNYAVNQRTCSEAQTLKAQATRDERARAAAERAKTAGTIAGKPAAVRTKRTENVTRTADEVYLAQLVALTPDAATAVAYLAALVELVKVGATLEELRILAQNWIRP